MSPAIRPPRLLRGGPHSAGRLLEVPLYSEVLRQWRAYAVWLPPGYSRSRRAFPAVYLFRGHHREWLKPFGVEPKYRLLPGAPVLREVEAGHVMEALVRGRHVRPLVLVMPCMANTDGSLSGLATDWAAPHLVRGKQARGVGTGRFGEHLVRELIPHVERHFHVVADRSGRAADGFSLGGFMAVKVALAHPELFCGTGAYDGSFFYLHQRPGKEGGAHDYLVGHALFDPVFDRPRRLDHVQRHSPAALLVRASDRALRSTLFYLQCGPQQAEPGDSNFYRTMHMVRLLQMRGIPNAASPIVYEDGHHDWPTAYRHLAQALRAFSDVLG